MYSTVNIKEWEAAEATTTQHLKSQEEAKKNYFRFQWIRFQNSDANQNPFPSICRIRLVFCIYLCTLDGVASRAAHYFFVPTTSALQTEHRQRIETAIGNLNRHWGKRAAEAQNRTLNNTEQLRMRNHWKVLLHQQQQPQKQQQQQRCCSWGWGKW